MAKWGKPRAGSRGYWHRKRAKRIFPVLRFAEGIKPESKALPIGFAAYKTGMTQVFLNIDKKGSPLHAKTSVHASTVLECPPLVVCGLKLYKKTTAGLADAGTLWAEKLSKDMNRATRIPKDTKTKAKLEEAEKNINSFALIRLLVHTQPRETGFEKKTPEIFEIPLSGDIKGQWEYAKQRLGGLLKAEDVFKEGESIDIEAVTTGRGHQGVVKRFGVKVRSRKNKAKMRHIGSLGPYHPARVLPVVIPHSGQMGFHNRTEYNKRILKIGSGGLTPNGGWLHYGILKGNYILLKGSIPGPKKRLILLRKACKPLKKEPNFKLENISLESQQ